MCSYSNGEHRTRNKGQGDLYLTSQGVLTRIAKTHRELFLLLNAHSDFHPERIPGSGKCTHVSQLCSDRLAQWDSRQDQPLGVLEWT